MTARNATLDRKIEEALVQRVERAVRTAVRSSAAESHIRLLSLEDDFEVLATLVSDWVADARAGAPEVSRAWAIARSVAIKERLVEQAGGVLKSAAVAGMLNISRQALAKQRRTGRLLALQTGSGDFLFPACQFENDKALPGLETALRAFRAEDPWYRLQVLVTSDPNLDGKTPIDALREGRPEDVVDAIRAHDDI